jgi:hypothetical protein
MDNTQMGLAGEFHVLAQLVQRGLVASLTLGNTKGVDILVADPRMDRLYKVEVKTTEYKLRKEALFGDERFLGWTVGAKNEHAEDPKLFYCFVALRGMEELPKFFVVPSVYVARYVRAQHRYWISTRTGAVAETSMRRFRIPESDPLGFGGNFGLLAGAPVPERQLTPSEQWLRPEFLASDVPAE